MMPAGGPPGEPARPAPVAQPCPACGSAQLPAYGFCPACGAERKGEAPAIAPAGAGPGAAGGALASMQRPIGITIFAAWLLFNGFANLGIAGFLATGRMDVIDYLTTGGVPADLANDAVRLVVPFLTVTGIASIAWGLTVLRSPRWAWPLSVGLVWFLLGLQVLSSFMNPASLLWAGVTGIILWYLYRPRIRGWFYRPRAR